MFQRFDAGALSRPRGGDKLDCQVRALTSARGINYDEAWDLLYKMQGERRHCGFMLVESLNAGDGRLGVIRKLDFPAVKNKKRMTATQFCKEHPRGRYILRMSHHVAAVKDGILLDTFDSSHKCVYTAWEVAPWHEEFERFEKEVT
jgi:hypothetical protein